jgi:hypothetical protein
MNLWQITSNGTVVVQNVSHEIAFNILQTLQTSFNLPGLHLSQMGA